MKKQMILLVLSLAMLLSTNPVLAQEEVFDDSNSAGAEIVSDIEVPDPEQPLFGFRVALMRLGQNVNVWLASSEERKAELELRYAEREEKLIEKIESVENPELQARLSELLVKAQEKHEERMARFDERVERVSTKKEEVAEKLKMKREEVEKRIEERRMEVKENVQQRQENRQERREDVKENIEERQENREDRREEIRDNVEERQENRQERRENRQGE